MSMNNLFCHQDNFKAKDFKIRTEEREIKMTDSTIRTIRDDTFTITEGNMFLITEVFMFTYLALMDRQHFRMNM